VSPDAELLERWRSGDDSAGERLLERHFAALLRFFGNKVGSRDDRVEDLIQRTMLAVVRSRDAFRGESSFRTYLFTIARHELYAQFRRQRRDAERFSPAEQSVADLGESPSAIVGQREEQKLLLAALRRLPLDLQVAVELAYWEDLTSEQMAAVLEIPTGTVKSRLRRGRELLRKHIERLSRFPALVESTVARLDDWARSIGAQVRPDDDVPRA
jgi:RNA polymerase sigma-70 factor (ECF subfamily)